MKQDKRKGLNNLLPIGKERKENNSPDHNQANILQENILPIVINQPANQPTNQSANLFRKNIEYIKNKLSRGEICVANLNGASLGSFQVQVQWFI